jgi:hypothetical protein
MSRGLLEFIDRFALAEGTRAQAISDAAGRNARKAAAGSQF